MSENLISDGLNFLWSSCSQAGCWILHRENKSQNFIGYYPRKVYWKILHCKLWWISRNALTHVHICILSQEVWPFVSVILSSIYSSACTELNSCPSEFSSIIFVVLCGVRGSGYSDTQVCLEDMRGEGSWPHQRTSLLVSTVAIETEKQHKTDIAMIANAVPCHSLLKGHCDHQYSF